MGCRDLQVVRIDPEKKSSGSISVPPPVSRAREPWTTSLGDRYGSTGRPLTRSLPEGSQPPGSATTPVSPVSGVLSVSMGTPRVHPSTDRLHRAVHSHNQDFTVSRTDPAPGAWVHHRHEAASGQPSPPGGRRHGTTTRVSPDGGRRAGRCCTRPACPSGRFRRSWRRPSACCPPGRTPGRRRSPRSPRRCSSTRCRSRR